MGRKVWLSVPVLRRRKAEGWPSKGTKFDKTGALALKASPVCPQPVPGCLSPTRE